MTQTNETNQELSPIDKLVTALVEEIRALFDKYSAKAEETIGGKFSAGLFPFLRQQGDGSFRPDARVVILPIKQSTDEPTGTNTADGGEGEKPAGGEESAEAPTTTG